MHVSLYMYLCNIFVNKNKCKYIFLKLYFPDLQIVMYIWSQYLVSILVPVSIIGLNIYIWSQ